MARIGLSTIQREEIRNIVFDDYIQKVSVNETINTLKRMYNLPDRFTPNWIHKLRQQFRNTAKTEIPRYQRDRFAYIQKYLNRIHSTEQLEKNAWKILRKEQDSEIKLKCISELRELQVLLSDLYSNLPRIANIKGGYGHSNENTDNTTIQEEYSEDDRKL